MNSLHIHNSLNDFLSVSFPTNQGFIPFASLRNCTNLHVYVILLLSFRFIMPGDVDLDDLPYEDMLSDSEELEMKKEKENKKRRELLAKVDFSRYTACQSVV